MDNIDRVIEFAETYKKPANPVVGEPFAIYDAIERLREESPRDFLNFYQQIKEFQRAKLMRSNTLPVEAGEDDHKEVNVIIHGNNRNTSISEDS